MRGARHFRDDVPSRKKPCSEMIGDDCNDCCSVVPCAYCLELEIYGEEIVYGHAPESAKHWTGTVGGYSFDAYWERNYETDICEFVVIFDGEEVYRQACGYISCRDSSDEVGITIGYDDATLRWRKHEPLPLEHVTDYETGCKTAFCDNCECSCECLCVVVTDSYGNELGRGEICNTSYPCDPPVWEGTIAGYALSLALGRDEYGQCIITPGIDGYDTDPVAAPGCGSMAATFDVETGVTASVTCKICGCEELEYPCPCCQHPGDTATIQGPISSTLVNIAFDPNGCVEASGLVARLDVDACGALAILGNASSPGSAILDASFHCVELADGSHEYLGMSPNRAIDPLDPAFLAAAPGSRLPAPNDHVWKWESASVTCPSCPDNDGFLSGYSGIGYQFCPAPPDPIGRNFGLYISAILDIYNATDC